ncbi:hypothetical protein TNCV_1678191 [Trichonephila clavipes]|nr:hypothetical protein TNCV_1678191 [Trichonephila clavipes]
MGSFDVVESDIHRLSAKTLEEIVKHHSTSGCQPVQHKPGVSPLNFIALQNWQVIDMGPRVHDASDL